jgi:hypothetical protein
MMTALDWSAPECFDARIQYYSDEQYNDFIATLKMLMRGNVPQPRAFECAHNAAIGLTVTGQVPREREEYDPVIVTAPKNDTGIVIGGALTLALAMDDLEFVASPILTRGQLGTLTGHPGHGKTTFFTGMCVALALRRAFGPIEPEADGLYYIVSAEDFQGTRNRLLGEAARLRLDDDDRARLDLRLRWVHVETNVGARAIKEAIAIDASDRDVALIFVDTGPALFCGDDENDNIALRNFVEGFKIMATLPGSPATILAWHPSKGAAADRLFPRGASAIGSTCDFNLTIWREDDRVTLGHIKVRGQHFDPIEGKLAAVDLIAASGDHYSAPVITIEAEDRAERSDARDAREAILRQLYDARLAPPSVTDLAKAISRSKSTVHRHLQHLATARPALVEKEPVDDRYSLTKSGEARAKALADRPTY